jgi:sec-independent protein translocase protein TatA
MFAVIGGLGMQELIIILVILLLLFGSTRLPQLAKGMGKSIREFKKGINDAGEDDPALPEARRESLRAGDAERIPEEKQRLENRG